MFILNIESGSKGNTTAIYNKYHELLIIDCGVKYENVLYALDDYKIDFNKLIGVFITHEHTDHLKFVNKYPEHLVYQTFKIKNTASRVNIISNKATLKVGHYNVEAVSLNHDAYDPVGYVISCNDEKISFITDTGFIHKSALLKFKNPNFLLIESNHDETMLLESERPFYLKKRILSEKGHLSNRQTMTYLKDLIGSNTKEIAFLHLSEECNKEEKVLEAYEDAKKHILSSEYSPKIFITSQHKVTQLGKLDE